VLKITIEIEPVDNQFPSLRISNQPIRVDEGNRKLISSDFLEVTDRDTIDENLNICVVQNFQNGFLGQDLILPGIF